MRDVFSRKLFLRCQQTAENTNSIHEYSTEMSESIIVLDSRRMVAITKGSYSTNIIRFFHGWVHFTQNDKPTVHAIWTKIVACVCKFMHESVTEQNDEARKYSL